MGKMTIEDVLAGRPLNWETVHALQRDKRMGLSPSGCIDASKQDADFANAVRDAGAELIMREKNPERSIPAEDSEAMQRIDGSHLTVEFLRKKMKDSRYSGDPWQRDPEYIRAIEDGFRELYPDKPDTGGIKPGISSVPHYLKDNYEK